MFGVVNIFLCRFMVTIIEKQFIAGITIIVGVLWIFIQIGVYTEL